MSENFKNIASSKIFALFLTFLSLKIISQFSYHYMAIFTKWLIINTCLNSILFFIASPLKEVKKQDPEDYQAQNIYHHSTDT